MGRSANRLVPGQNLTAKLLGFTGRRCVGDKDLFGKRRDKTVPVKGHSDVRAVSVVGEG